MLFRMLNMFCTSTLALPQEVFNAQYGCFLNLSSSSSSSIGSLCTDTHQKPVAYTEGGLQFFILAV